LAQQFIFVSSNGQALTVQCVCLHQMDAQGTVYVIWSEIFMTVPVYKLRTRMWNSCYFALWLMKSLN